MPADSYRRGDPEDSNCTDQWCCQGTAGDTAVSGTMWGNAHCHGEWGVVDEEDTDQEREVGGVWPVRSVDKVRDGCRQRELTDSNNIGGGSRLWTQKKWCRTYFQVTLVKGELTHASTLAQHEPTTVKIRQDESKQIQIKSTDGLKK